MGCADGNGQGVAACLLDKPHGIVGIGVDDLVAAFHIVFQGADGAQFCFHGDVQRVRQCAYLFCDPDVLLKTQMGSVDHDGGKTGAERPQDGAEITVVQMDAHGDTGFVCPVFAHFDKTVSHEIQFVRMDRQDDGCIELFTGIHDTVQYHP